VESLPIRLSTPGLDFVQRRVDLSLPQSYRTVKSSYGGLRPAGIIFRKFNDAGRSSRVKENSAGDYRETNIGPTLRSNSNATSIKRQPHPQHEISFCRTNSRALAIDKIGTITEGCPRVIRFGATQLGIKRQMLPARPPL